MKNITILLPVHTIDGDYNDMLMNAIHSIEDFHNDVKLSIICPPSVKSKLTELSQKLEIKIIENKGDIDFCSQINLGIEDCDTKWFSILEIDDEYRPQWLKIVNEYTEQYTDVGVFLPIVKDVNVEGKFTGFTNEAPWAYGFTETQGYVDNEVLLDFQNFQTSGGVFNTEIIKEFGSFKENLKLTFTYEFLLRLTHKGVKVMIIPRIGYQHVNFREDSMFWKYQEEGGNEKLSEDQVKFWVEQAKKEFFFKNKRDIIDVV